MTIDPTAARLVATQLRFLSAQCPCDGCRAKRDAAVMIESLLAERDHDEQRVADLMSDVQRIAAEREALQSRLDAVREVYAGMDGFIGQTAPDGYCLRIIEKMARAAIVASDD